MDKVTIVRAGKSIIHKRHRVGNTGRILSKRKPKNPTTPSQKVANTTRAAFEATKLINENFKKGDYSICLTYDDESLPDDHKQARNCIKNFLRNLKNAYNSEGFALKYIYNIEYSEKGRLHHHLVVNGDVPLETIEKKWTYGHVHYKPLDDTGEYSQLAEYIVKGEHWEAFGGSGKKWVRSTNLFMPEEEITIEKSLKHLQELENTDGYAIMDYSVKQFFDKGGSIHQKYIETQAEGRNNQIYDYYDYHDSFTDL